MKNVLLTLVLFLSAMAACAQTSPAAKKDVADIRKLYTESKQEMDGLDKMEREGLPLTRRCLAVILTRRVLVRQRS